MPVRDLPAAVRATGWFLSLSYLLGGAVFAALEFHGQFASARFGYAPGFVYLVCVSQVTCAVLLFNRRFAPWSAALLTLISVGAIASHLRIHSPLTALPALAYTVLQVWFGVHVYRDARNG